MRRFNYRNRHKSHEAGKKFVTNYNGPYWPCNCWNTRANIYGEHASVLFNVPAADLAEPKLGDWVNESTRQKLDSVKWHARTRPRGNRVPESNQGNHAQKHSGVWIGILAGIGVAGVIAWIVGRNANGSTIKN